MSRRDSRDTGALVYGDVPRAHLMPPEVGFRRKERGRRRGLITAIVAACVLTVAGIVGSFAFAANAEARLADERRTTEQLLATQLEYTEVTLVLGQLQSITDVRGQLALVEVQWSESLAPYLSVLSAEEVVESLAFASNAPAEPSIGTTGPLRSARVATATMVVLTAEPPNPGDWYREWEQVETFADASIDSIILLQQGYQTRVTINLNELALSQRLGEEEDSE